MKTLKTMAYFEPGSNGSPACLPVWMAIKEFNSESRATIKYGPELFPPAKLTLHYREGRKETKEVLIGGIDLLIYEN
jgi:hypothetical protein